MTVKACGECHAMEGHVADLRDPKSDSLAAVHYKNRYILENQCYTCHSDYGMFGTREREARRASAHLLQRDRRIREADQDPRTRIPNLRCLSCHGGAQNFLAKHEKEQIENLLAGKDSCLDCHGPAHKAEEAGEVVPAKKASR